MVSSLFVCHGAPSLAIDNNEYTSFLKELGNKIKPKAIVIFTAHWESDITTISYTNDTYDIIYDFYGFPKELYSIKYKAKGSIELASKIKNLFDDNKISSKFDSSRGLDHGSWVVLQMMYPNADIPIVQVSVNPKLSMENQYKIGAAIKELGKDDVLVIGSGSTVHNLSTIDWEADKPEVWAEEFDSWLIDKIEKNYINDLFAYKDLAPYARRAVPREEHIVPLFIALGAGQNEDTSKLMHRSYEYGTLSYICFQF